MKFLMREANLRDVSQLKELASLFFLCSLIPEEEEIKNKINQSIKSFNKELPKEERNFLFVLEDIENKKIIGSSQILSAYNKNNLPYLTQQKKEGKTHLCLQKNLEGRHQVGGLILHPDYRQTKEKLGLLLGGVRYLYIGGNSDEFSKILEANLTAPFEEEENYHAFWEELGRHYLDLNFLDALRLYRKEKDKFFSRFPEKIEIPLEQLSKQAQIPLTEVHEETRSARRALLKLGFKETKKYHLLDGGIYLEAPTQQISLVSKMRPVTLKKATQELKSLYLLGQETKEGFKSGFVEGWLDEDTLYLTEPRFLQKGAGRSFAIPC